MCISPAFLAPIAFAAIAIPLVAFCGGMVYGEIVALRRMAAERSAKDSDSRSDEE